MAENPLLQVVTWIGTGADLPQLRKRNATAMSARGLEIVERGHLDLFHWARNAVRLPIPRLALGDVAGYFAIPKLSGISDGLTAMSLYENYCRSRDESLKAELLEYNRDDLDALVGVAERFALLSADRKSTPFGSQG